MFDMHIEFLHLNMLMRDLLADNHSNVGFSSYEIFAYPDDGQLHQECETGVVNNSEDLLVCRSLIVGYGVIFINYVLS